MTNILILRSSVLGEASASNHVIDETLADLEHAGEAVQIVERDLAAKPLPHFDADAFRALRAGVELTAEQQKARALSDTLIAEIKAADIILIGAPMYNFGIASQLKSWFDFALRPGVTFRYTEAGPEGLVNGKRAIVVVTRGGLYSEGPAAVMDSQEPHLRTMLGFMGISEVSFVRAEKLGFGPEAREAALAGARGELTAHVRPVLAKAA
ncbi:MAG: FMN-dependent NADH-azoreductase [Cereibacter sphaeroides]|uniref:FMN dependent NADH:quinone oxidoreductase n=1 Tax=Cereibacter sphaeroides TaxID=1063 RepID=A0A2W5SEC5_CERSP|nr:MAG: FMN-dependent NADH-azoreductase [Cereibacter sphaeroides]